MQDESHQVPYMITDDMRKAMSEISAFYHNRVWNDGLQMIGITGTKGKSTTATFVKAIMDNYCMSQGKKEIGFLSGIYTYDGERKVKAKKMTTPETVELHHHLAACVDNGCEYLVMETSSQAFHQMRLAGIHFKTGIFTNLTQDHLDYHGTIEEYMACKKVLFRSCDNAVINADDEAGEYMVEGTGVDYQCYGINSDCSFKAENTELYADRVEYDLNGEHVVFHIPGGFSVYNSLAAIAGVCSLGFSFESVIESISSAGSVKGRLELLKTDTEYGIIIDYAHTPDGLEKALNAVRGFTEGRVITLFGCGGDRDKTKRPKMGRMATDLSDIVVVTTDNPRTEDPDEIIKEILIGTVGSKAEVVSIADRSEAIRYAMSIAGKGDTILLAGKGHETYQVIGKERVHYDEREVVAEILNS